MEFVSKFVVSRGRGEGSERTTKIDAFFSVNVPSHCLKLRYLKRLLNALVMKRLSFFLQFLVVRILVLRRYLRWLDICISFCKVLTSLFETANIEPITKSSNS